MNTTRTQKVSEVGCVCVYIYVSAVGERRSRDKEMGGGDDGRALGVDTVLFLDRLSRASNFPKQAT